MLSRRLRFGACVLVVVVATTMGLFATTAAPQPRPDRASSAQVTQKFMCERGYVNFAFGYQSAGIYVDGRGDVYHYQFEQGAKPWMPASTQTPTEQELEAKYSHGRKLLRTVDAKELAAMIPLIAEAKKGPYSKHESTGADRGGYGSTCYWYDATKRRYREVEIEEEGDFTYKNLSPAAATLARWLVSLTPPDR